jgi:hypothetical protein
MKVVQRAAALAAALCMTLLVWSLPIHASSSQLLYVQVGHNLTTYRVSPGQAAKLGTLGLHASADFPIQIFHSPAGHYLYVLGFTSPTEEYFWVYAISERGLPAAGPIQKLAVKPSLTQFFFHPKGNFGYALYSWVDNNREFVGDIVLYTVNPKTGILTNTKRPVAAFPASYYWQTFIYGLSKDGSKLYTRASVDFDDANGNDFYSYAINPHTGRLGSRLYFWQDDAGTEGTAFSDISEQLIALDFNQYGGPVGISVYPNAVNPANPIFTCTSSMAAVCGDTLASTPTQFDPSGRYLLINDASIGSVVITQVDVRQKRLDETGSSIPGNPRIISFSPDSSLIYAVEDKNVWIYGFDPASGSLTTKISVSFPLSVRGLLSSSHP